MASQRPVLPIADDDNTFTIPETDPHIRNNFHRILNRQIEKELRQHRSCFSAYDRAYVKSMKMLSDNQDHIARPSLGHLTGVVYKYTDPTTNFAAVYEIDPVVAIWAGHLFICLQKKVCFVLCVFIFLFLWM